MKTVALAAFLSLGLSVPALAQTTNGQDMAQDEGGEMAQRLDIPTPENATLRECQAWLGQVGVTIEGAEESDLSDAEDTQREVARACDDGDYYEGITMAAELITSITGEDFTQVADDDDEQLATELDVPTAEDATQRGCLAWIGQLGVSINAAEEAGMDVEQADERRREARRACDDGDYYEGITLAAETIDMLDGNGDAEMGQAQTD